MKLAVPLRSIDEVLPLVEAGADELYCGVKEPSAGVGYIPNSIVISKGSFASFKELSDAVALAASRKVPILFCANSSQGRHTLERLRRDIARAHEIGIRRIVVTDMALIPWIKNRFPDFHIVLSTLCPSFNSESLTFFAQMGISRVVLDSVRTLREISEMAEQTKRLGIDVEVFTTPQNCLNIRANCNFHTWFICNAAQPGRGSAFLKPCHAGLPISVYEKRKSGWACLEPARLYPPQGFVGPSCVVCALWHLHQWGVAFVKIVGRHYPLARKLMYLRLAKKYIRDLEDGTITSENFFDKGKEAHKLIMGCDCGKKNCFYPEIRSMRDHGARLAREYSREWR